MAAGKYGSDGMIARRRRIIETALDLMANNKGEFTMRDLAQASDVATGTLYNLFGSQDALVAEAVVTVFEERVDRLVVEPEGDNIADLVRARGDAAYKEIMRVPAYAKTMVKIYFAGEPGSPVRKKLHEIPKTGWVATFEKLAADGLLASWVIPEHLADQLTSSQYAVVARWAAEEIDDEALRNGTFFAACTLLAGALLGDRQQEVLDALQALRAQDHKNATDAA